MTTDSQPAGRDFRSLAPEIVCRTLCVSLNAWFVYRSTCAYMESHNPAILMLLATEVITTILLVTARFPKEINRGFYVMTITVSASFYFLFVDLTDGKAFALGAIPFLLQGGGILLQLYAKVYLGRSFALLPANRGIVSTGPYKMVRHPIYLGYLLVHIGFLLTVWSWFNLGVYVALHTLQILRICEEEKVLIRDEEYRDYTSAVHYRLIPKVF